MKKQNEKIEPSETKLHLLDAGVKLMRVKGYNATTVDDICSEAGVTKGGFFHYFKGKEEMAKAALARFHEGKDQSIQDAPFAKLADPLDRVYGRLDYIKESVGGKSRLTQGCLIGVFAQELSFTHPELRSQCQDLFLRIAKDFEKDLAEAKAMYAPAAKFSPKRVALLYVSIFQGSSMMAKASETNTVLLDNIEEFRGYLQTLLEQAGRQEEMESSDRFATAKN
jgi:TetR/AcrR family transcriptional repressor of nem operon